MNIQNVEIQNFLAIGSVSMNMLEKGLVLLQGENRDDSSQDSNGAGKSALPDALSWCFYGVTARGESGDDVINRTAGKNCFVKIFVEDTGITYEIARHRKHKENKNRLTVRKESDGKWEDLTLGTDKLTQNLVNKIIGCTKEVFCSAIYAGQENLVDLPSMTDKSLKVIVEEAAGIDRLQNGYKIATARVNSFKKEHDLTLRELNSTLNGIALTEENLEDAKGLEKAWESKRNDKMVKATTEKEVLVKELKKTKDIDASVELEQIEQKIEKINAAIDSANKRSSEHAVLESKLASAISQVKREKSVYESNLIDVQKAEKQLKSITEERNPTCGECGQEISNDEAKSAHIKTHEERLTNLRNKADEQESIVREKGMEARNIKLELSELKIKLTDTSKLKAAIEKLTERKTALILQSSAVKTLQEKINAKQADFVAARDESNPHLAMIRKLDENLVAMNKKKTSQDEEVQKSEHKLLVAEGAAKVFSPSGVRAHLLDQVTPYLNDRTSHYLSILSDGNITATWTTLAPDSKGDLKEKFSIAVESSTGGKSFRSLSGGEKRKVRLSTYLALQDLVSSRASKPINLLIADEIDQAVDKSGLERLMSVLTEKAKERGTAIVISHTDLKSWISNSVTVVKEEGMSRMEGLALA